MLLLNKKKNKKKSEISLITRFKEIKTSIIAKIELQMNNIKATII